MASSPVLRQASSYLMVGVGILHIQGARQALMDSPEARSMYPLSFVSSLFRDNFYIPVAPSTAQQPHSWWLLAKQYPETFNRIPNNVYT